ncbi:hypothetical protein D3C81_2100250 [compost metagenome]
MSFKDRPNAALRLAGDNPQQKIVATAKLGKKRQNTIIKRFREIRRLTQAHEVFFVALCEPMRLLINLTSKQLSNSERQRKADDRMCLFDFRRH